MNYFNKPWKITKNREFIVNNNGEELFNPRQATKEEIQLVLSAPDMLLALEKLCEEPELPNHIADYLLPILRKAKNK